MHKNNTLPWALLIVFSSHAQAPHNKPVPYFSKTASSMQNLFEQMHNDFEAMMNDVYSEVQAIQPNKQPVVPTITESDNHITLAIQAPEIDPDNFPDMIKKMTDQKEDYLVVTIPSKTITSEIIIKKNTFSLRTKQEVKEEKTDKESGKNSALYYASGSSLIQQSLPASVNFNEIKAEHENNTLTITLEKCEPTKNGQRIAVIKK